jgi:SWI/SNF-related matrix-associated actin-dependent regulator of chromatin subfamily A-like protein 1
MNDMSPLKRDPCLFDGLYRHQQDELEKLLSTVAHYLLFWEQGCGKTPVAARLGRAIGDGPKLYLCPASCKAQVARELVRFGGPGTKVQILEGRRATLRGAADWVVCNYDLLLSGAVFQQLIAQRWSLLIADESHLCRTLGARRTKLVFGAAPCLAGQADRVICLTGTPVVNSPVDIFPMVNRLFPNAIAIPGDDGKPRRMQFPEFAARYCVFRTVHLPGGKTKQVPSGAQNVAELRARLAPHMTRLRRRDVLDLPALRINNFALSVKPTAELIAALKSVPPALLEQLQDATDDELLALLRQHMTALSSLRRVIGVSKATAAADHIAERIASGEDRVIGFFHHKEVANVMLAQLQLADVSARFIRGDTPVTTRTILIDDFNNGKVPVLLLQNQSGSLGLNLQSCCYAAIVEPDWTAAVTEQAIARLYRAGQVRDVTIEFLLLPGSIDEHINNTAMRKASIAEALIENRVEEEQYA